MKTQIPIYRAKKLDSGEYVIGWLANPTPSLFYIFYNHCGYLNVNNEVCIQENERAEIDPSTLAIHFPDMLDSEGTKIFASLSEDGSGGDITQPSCGGNCSMYRNTAKYSDKGFGYCHSNLKVVGIQK